MIAEIKGRYAKISEYNGEVTYIINNGQPVTSDAELKTIHDYISTAFDKHVVEFVAYPNGTDV